MKYSYDCKSLYALCAGELEKSIKDEILLFIAVRSFITKINGDDSKIDISEINSHVAGMLERAIQDDEMLQIGNVHNSNKIVLLSDELINKISKMQKKNIAVEILNKALKDYIEKVGKQNIVLMEKFSTKFKKIADAYNERISIEDIEKIIQEMIQLKIEIEKELAAGNEYNLSIEEKAFFDALGNDPQIKELMKDETLVKIAKELVDIINNNMTIDWDIRKDARARMRYEIKKLLIKYNYPPIKREDAVQLVIKQAELKCKNMIEE
jgi:type I site-specific deoxyribonuclease, hsdR family